MCRRLCTRDFLQLSSMLRGYYEIGGGARCCRGFGCATVSRSSAFTSRKSNRSRRGASSTFSKSDPLVLPRVPGESGSTYGDQNRRDGLANPFSGVRMLLCRRTNYIRTIVWVRRRFTQDCTLRKCGNLSRQQNWTVRFEGQSDLYRHKIRATHYYSEDRIFAAVLVLFLS